MTPINDICKAAVSNYHSHSLYCDGRAGMEDFVRFALSRGFTSYGFSSHAPLPFPTAWTMEWDRMDDYLAEFRRLKEKYAGRIELYIGLEIDYLNEESHPAAECFRRLPLDYRIGSVHLLCDDEGRVVDADLSADKFRRMVDEYFQGDVERVVRQYYERSWRMVELGGFDIVGHADKVHYNANCYQPGWWTSRGMIASCATISPRLPAAAIRWKSIRKPMGSWASSIPTNATSRCCASWASVCR